MLRLKETRMISSHVFLSEMDAELSLEEFFASTTNLDILSSSLAPQHQFGDRAADGQHGDSYGVYECNDYSNISRASHDWLGSSLEMGIGTQVAGDFWSGDALGAQHSMQTPSQLDCGSNQEQNQGDLDKSLSPPKSLSNSKNVVRFSQTSLAVLRNFVSAHPNTPYPSEEQKETLSRRSGLSKTQVTTWLANARRRGTRQPIPNASPSTLAEPRDIINRPPTPALNAMNPFERWRSSPPEDEHSFSLDVVNAASSLDGVSSWFGSVDGETRPALSTRSSDGSSNSTFSHHSGSSSGSMNLQKRRNRRRCRRIPKTFVDIRTTTNPHTYQCTFCTKSFKRKYDWKRHEQSLHLSLERWICAPDGPSFSCSKTQVLKCVFCQLLNPDEAHFETHNFLVCNKKSLETRTFYRQDHMRQHLKLLHNSSFQESPMDKWKVEMHSIKSRCGFCDSQFDSWSSRVDHLATHFSAGSDMVDWKGGWGFDLHVQNLIENGIPPCKTKILGNLNTRCQTDNPIDLIHVDRQSLLPFSAAKTPPRSRIIKYDLIKKGLTDFLNRQSPPLTNSPDEDLKREASSILAALSNSTNNTSITENSWFHDLFLDETQNGSAGLRLLDSQETFTYQTDCPLDFQLRNFVTMQKNIGHAPTDPEIQIQALKILADVEFTSTCGGEQVSSWFRHLVLSSTFWIAPFRRRVLDTDMENSEHFQVDGMLEDRGFLSELNNCAKFPTVVTEPTSLLQEIEQTTHEPSQTPQVNAANTGFDATAPQDHFLDDPNSYQRLRYELLRFTASCLSVNNPAQHIPSDAEIQNQARWIIFDDDDPWNQTAADNPGWLDEFKHDAGLL